MDEQQIIDLLKVASAYDSRKPDHAAVLAWREAAGRARWTFPAALDAIHAHYAESAERIMPGHVTARLRAEVRRAFDQDVESALGLPTGPPASAARRAELVAEVKRRWAR